MQRDPVLTRGRILDATEALVLERGYGATTVDAIVARAGVTKGAFFHHFASKNELARAVVVRYAERDRAASAELLRRAERLSRDPLQQVLIVITLLEEQMATLLEPFPGCLFASYCYQAGLFDDATMDIVRGTMRRWREELAGKLRAAVAAHALATSLDVDALADMYSALLEGAFILSRTLNDAGLIAQQLAHYRRYIELLFAAAADHAPRSGAG